MFLVHVSCSRRALEPSPAKIKTQRWYKHVRNKNNTPKFPNTDYLDNTFWILIVPFNLLFQRYSRSESEYFPLSHTFSKNCTFTSPGPTKFHSPMGPERRFFEIRPYKSMKDSEILAFLQEKRELQLEPSYTQNIYGWFFAILTRSILLPRLVR